MPQTVLSEVHLAIFLVCIVNVICLGGLNIPGNDLLPWTETIYAGVEKSVVMKVRFRHAKVAINEEMIWRRRSCLRQELYQMGSKTTADTSKGFASFTLFCGWRTSRSVSIFCAGARNHLRQ